MNTDQLFDKDVFIMTIEELLTDMDFLLEEIAPEGKSVSDFTGGYVQQLSHSTRLIAFYGSKPGTNNRSTGSVDIENDEMDTMYMMLKAKIHQIRNRKKSGKVQKISLAQRRMARKNEAQPADQKGW